MRKKILIVVFCFFAMLALSAVLWYFAGREVPAVQQHRVIETKYDTLDQTGESRARGNTTVLEESRANLAPTEKRKVYSPVQPVEPAKNFLISTPASTPHALAWGCRRRKTLLNKHT